jgi:hypothetical protein
VLNILKVIDIARNVRADQVEKVDFLGLDSPIFSQLIKTQGNQNTSHHKDKFNQNRCPILPLECIRDTPGYQHVLLSR